MDFLPTTINQVHTNHDWSLAVDSTNIRLNFGFEGLKTGIVPFLRLFGRELRQGTFNQKTFLKMYKHHCVHDLKQLTLLDDNTAWDEQKRLAFYLFMVRVSVEENWTYPALISRDINNRLDQATGMSRAFASLITNPAPWQHYPVLLCEKLFANQDLWEQCNLVTTDRQLHEVLDRDYNKTSDFKPKTNINLKIFNQNNNPYPRLEYIGNGTYHDETPMAAQTLLKKFIQWRNRYSRPTIKIWTAWPDLVRNTNDFWQIQQAGSSADLATQTTERPGLLETAVKHFHANQRNSMTTDYELWIVKPKVFDLATLLPWMNLDANVLINKTHDFVLYRADSEWKSQTVEIHSHLQ